MFEVMKRRSDVRAYALVADHTPKHNEEKHWTPLPQPGHRILRGRGQDRQDPQGAGDLRRDAARRLPATTAWSSALLAEPPYDRDSGPEIVERYARKLEEEIRRSPADWLWLHRKWKYRKPLYRGDRLIASRAR